jgi:copper(I)-binding protein
MSPYISGLCLFAAVTGAGALLNPSLCVASPLGVVLAADDGITVSESWARASPGATTTGAAYVTLKGGSRPEQLIGASTPVAATAEAHETINDNGVMKMRPVGPISVLPGQTVTFAPGGTHIMLMGLKQKLTEGQSFPLTLTFAHAAPITVEVKVRGMGGAAGGTMGDHMSGHDGMPMH